MMTKEKAFLVRSIYGAKSRGPIVEITYDDFNVMISPEEAQSLAGNLLQAAEAAIADAFLVEFIVDLTKDEIASVGILHAFREFREYQQGKNAGTKSEEMT